MQSHARPHSRSVLAHGLRESTRMRMHMHKQKQGMPTPHTHARAQEVQLVHMKSADVAYARRPRHLCAVLYPLWLLLCTLALSIAMSILRAYELPNHSSLNQPLCQMDAPPPTRIGARRTA
eukprot:6214053-Pleurochrysis_carterae.AAC.10